MKKLLLTVYAVLIILTGAAFWAFYLAMKAETNVRYSSTAYIVSEKLANTIRGMEMNAMNVFDEVEKHLDTPETVEAALKSKAKLNPDVKGYFAAFRPEYFKEKGQWYEPYVHKAKDGGYDMTQVGSARHDYTKSPWYVQAEKIMTSFWSEPYYYYDGSSISGHYCTFVEPILDSKGEIVCVCGADVTLEWLSNELMKIDEKIKTDKQLNKFPMLRALDYYSVVYDHDGTCIVHPEGKNMAIKDVQVLMDMNDKKSGTAELTIDGEPSLIFYDPIGNMDWTAAVIVSKQDIFKPFIYVGIALLLLMIIGGLIVWIVCHRGLHEKSA